MAVQRELPGTTNNTNLVKYGYTAADVKAKQAENAAADSVVKPILNTGPTQPFNIVNSKEAQLDRVDQTAEDRAVASPVKVTDPSNPNQQKYGFTGSDVKIAQDLKNSLSGSTPSTITKTDPSLKGITNQNTPSADTQPKKKKPTKEEALAALAEKKKAALAKIAADKKAAADAKAAARAAAAASKPPKNTKGNGKGKTGGSTGSTSPTNTGGNTPPTDTSGSTYSSGGSSRTDNLTQGMDTSTAADVKNYAGSQDAYVPRVN
jgi:hypothetical protein